MMKNGSLVKRLRSHWQTLQPSSSKGMGCERLSQKEDTDIDLNVFRRKGNSLHPGSLSKAHFDHVAISPPSSSENTDAL